MSPREARSGTALRRGRPAETARPYPPAAPEREQARKRRPTGRIAPCRGNAYRDPKDRDSGARPVLTRTSADHRRQR